MIEIESAIIMTDNVDMEWDIEDQLKRIWSYLPDDWDIVHLGAFVLLSTLRPTLVHTILSPPRFL